MSRTGLLAGIGEIVRDPQLLLIEIGWRWSFGAIGLRTLLAAFRVSRGDLAAKGSSPTAIAPSIGQPPPKDQA